MVEQKKDVLLAVVGSYESESYEISIQKMVSDLKLKGNILFMGYVEEEWKIRELLCSSKLFVFPSRREGFANTVLQAMAVGLPCIVSDIPALRELYGDVAVLVPPDDKDAFAKEVIQLLNDTERRNALGAKSRSFAKTMSVEKAARKMINALDNALN